MSSDLDEGEDYAWPQLSQCYANASITNTSTLANSLAPLATFQSAPNQPSTTNIPPLPYTSLPSSVSYSPLSSSSSMYSASPYYQPSIPQIANYAPSLASQAAAGYAAASLYPPVPVQQHPTSQLLPALTVQNPPKPRSGSRSKNANSAVVHSNGGDNAAETMRNLMKQLDTEKKEHQTFAIKSAEVAHAHQQRILELEHKNVGLEQQLVQAMQTLSRVSTQAPQTSPTTSTHCDTMLAMLPVLKVLCQHLESHASTRFLLTCTPLPTPQTPPSLHSCWLVGILTCLRPRLGVSLRSRPSSTLRQMVWR